MTRFPHPRGQVRPNGVLEKVIMDFAPVILDHPASLAAIRKFVFAPPQQAIAAADLMNKLYDVHGVFMAPELAESFVTCLAGVRNFVTHYCIDDVKELESAMLVRNEQVARRINFLRHKP